MRSAFFFLVAVPLLAIFAAMNWPAFTQPTEINFLVATAVAPLGIVLLGVIGVLLLALALVLTWAYAARLLQHRAHARESEKLRALSEDAEASRLAQLRAWLETEMRSQAERSEQIAARLSTRMDGMEAVLLRRQEEGENSLSAHLGELEDRLDGSHGPSSQRHYS